MNEPFGINDTPIQDMIDVDKAGVNWNTTIKKERHQQFFMDDMYD